VVFHRNDTRLVPWGILLLVPSHTSHNLHKAGLVNKEKRRELDATICVQWKKRKG
jgi:hypothetical protein